MCNNTADNILKQIYYFSMCFFRNGGPSCGQGDESYPALSQVGKNIYPFFDHEKIGQSILLQRNFTWKFYEILLYLKRLSHLATEAL